MDHHFPRSQNNVSHMGQEAPNDLTGTSATVRYQAWIQGLNIFDNLMPWPLISPSSLFVAQIWHLFGRNSLANLLLPNRFLHQKAPPPSKKKEKRVQGPRHIDQDAHEAQEQQHGQNHHPRGCVRESGLEAIRDDGVHISWRTTLVGSWFQCLQVQPRKKTKTCSIL